MAQLGHKWVDEKILYDWGRKVDFLRCTRCGYLFQAKTTLPEDTMLFLKIPTCDEFLIKLVDEA